MTETQEAPAPIPATEGAIVGLLTGRYATPEWAFVHGLRTHVGYSTPGRETYMDAFAMRCWPGKGLMRVGFEIKVARNDWMRELKHPEKRQASMALTHEFWFVAPVGVIRNDEIPEGCGWMEVTGAGLRVKKAAPYREVGAMPEAFIASLLRALIGRNDIFDAAIFRLAGRDLSAADLIAAQRDAIEQAVKAGVARELPEAMVKRPEYALAHTVADAMSHAGGVGSWRWRSMHGVPSPEEFRRWIEAFCVNGGMEENARTIDGAIMEAESLVSALRRTRANMRPGTKP